DDRTGGALHSFHDAVAPSGKLGPFPIILNDTARRGKFCFPAALPMIWPRPAQSWNDKNFGFRSAHTNPSLTTLKSCPALSRASRLCHCHWVLGGRVNPPAPLTAAPSPGQDGGRCAHSTSRFRCPRALKKSVFSFRQRRA